MKDKSLESVFRHKLEDFSIEPSARAKDLIRQRINKRGRIILYRRLSVAASIVVITVMGVFYLIPDHKEITLAEQRDTPDKKQDLVVNEDTTEIKKIAEVQKSVQSRTGTGDDQKSQSTRNSEREVPAKSNQNETEKPEIRDKEVHFPMAVTAEEKSDIPDSIQIASPGDLLLPDNRFTEITEDTGEDPMRLSEVSAGQSAAAEKPLKITIEYIASGSKGKRSGNPKTQAGELYSKVNKLVYPNEVLGDIRSLKDQLFALEFINRKSTHTQNNKEK